MLDFEPVLILLLALLGAWFNQNLGELIMDTHAFLNIGFYIVMTIFILSTLGLIVLICIYLAKRARKSKKIQRTEKVLVRPTYYSPSPSPKHPKKDIFPNGFSRQDYNNHGADDSAIDYFCLDLPGAPEPGIAGFVMMELLKENKGKK